MMLKILNFVVNEVIWVDLLFSLSFFLKKLWLLSKQDKDILRLVLQQSIDLPENMKADSCIIQKVASVLSTHEQIYDSWEKNEIVLNVDEDVVWYRSINQAQKIDVSFIMTLYWFFPNPP